MTNYNEIIDKIIESFIYTYPDYPDNILDDQFFEENDVDDVQQIGDIEDEGGLILNIKFIKNDILEIYEAKCNNKYYKEDEDIFIIPIEMFTYDDNIDGYIIKPLYTRKRKLEEIFGNELK
jgi:hypothetical protein